MFFALDQSIVFLSSRVSVMHASIRLPRYQFVQRSPNMRFSEPSFFVDGLWRLSVIGEFRTLSGFRQENLQFEYAVQQPDGWFQRNHNTQMAAVSQKCRVNDQCVAQVCLPFSMDFLVADESNDKKKQTIEKSDEPDGDTNREKDEHVADGVTNVRDSAGISWPRLCVRVYAIDQFGRRMLSGIGSASLPQSAGQHTVTICTCRSVSGNNMDQLSEHFLGFIEDDEDGEERDVVHTHPQVTETSGTVTVGLNCILRSAASIEKRKRDRELLSASIEEVVAAFEQAKLEMLEVRQRVLKEQRDYGMMIQRTYL